MLEDVPPSHVVALSVLGYHIQLPRITRFRVSYPVSYLVRFPSFGFCWTQGYTCKLDLNSPHTAIRLFQTPCRVMSKLPRP